MTAPAVWFKPVVFEAEMETQIGALFGEDEREEALRLIAQAAGFFLATRDGLKPTAIADECEAINRELDDFGHLSSQPSAEVMLALLPHLPRRTTPNAFCRELMGEPSPSTVEKAGVKFLRAARDCKTAGRPPNMSVRGLIYQLGLVWLSYRKWFD